MAEIPITQNDARIQYVSVGGEPNFTYDFPIFDQADIVVLRAVDSLTAAVTLVITTDYTVTGVGAVGGGTIVPVATPVVNQIWTIFRDVDEARLADFTQGGPFKAATVNREEDIQTMIAQQLRRDMDRAVRLAEGDTANSALLPLKDARKSQFLAFDGNGDLIAAAGTSADLGPVSAYIDTLLDNVDAAAARLTLGAAGMTDAEKAQHDRAFALSSFQHGGI